ncbi:MAG TPA: zinc-binding dehydrogenase [Pseudonocardiaceae bacterium]|jgi:threonine dehydrogenase-like Zn-dependent dehydrogenase|nr:zinc-binding dehydrogenase [Pseudonocardiaceae bacterium]
MNLALEYRRSAGRYFAARAISYTRTGGRLAGALASNMAPLRLVEQVDPVPGDESWTRIEPVLSGICGSDLGLLTGRSSPYLGPLTSMPFVLGHEVVGRTLDELPGLPRGSRVVIDPVLRCAARSLPACPACLEGDTCRCDRITTGGLAAGLQTGFCADTGGGWSRRMLAHASQLHPVPDPMPDEIAVLVEPLACAVHAVRRVPISPGASVLVVGAGTVGLLTLLALRKLTAAGEVHVIAKHRHQADRARELGATQVIGADGAVRAIRRSTGALLVEPELGEDYLLGGMDLAFECTGASGGLNTALRSLRAGGTVVASGMPAGGVDLTPLWFRELRLVGAYASAIGEEPGKGDFPEAIALATAAPLDGYVDMKYPLDQWRDAVDHAAAAGRLGTIKVVFAPGRG